MSFGGPPSESKVAGQSEDLYNQISAGYHPSSQFLQNQQDSLHALQDSDYSGGLTGSSIEAGKFSDETAKSESADESAYRRQIEGLMPGEEKTDVAKEDAPWEAVGSILGVGLQGFGDFAGAGGVPGLAALF